MSEGIRRRNVQSVAENPDPGAFESLRNFDIYSKVKEDCVEKSSSGSVVTLITSLIVFYLFWTELGEFLTVDIVDSIAVDTSINQKLPIKMNITFPHLRCDEVSVDTVDVQGDNQIDVHGGIRKQELDARGRPVPSTPLPKASACLPCLEAEDELHKCCNTCQSLKDAYMSVGLPYYHVLDTASQCKGSVGCQVHGSVVVNKNNGNVHVALGRSTTRRGKVVHEFNIADINDGYNTSHAIHHLGFGDPVPGVATPLDGTTKIVKHGAVMFHYYVRLVPTVFTNRWGEKMYTNQYSVSDTARDVKVRNGELTGLPGVFVVYNFSPFLMEKTERTKPWSYIFTSMCAIIGGVISLASLVEIAAQSVVIKLFGCSPAVLSEA